MYSYICPVKVHKYNNDYTLCMQIFKTHINYNYDDHIILIQLSTSINVTKKVTMQYIIGLIPYNILVMEKGLLDRELKEK